MRWRGEGKERRGEKERGEVEISFLSSGDASGLLHPQ